MLPGVRNIRPQFIKALLANAVATAALAAAVPALATLLGMPWNRFWDNLGGFFVPVVMVWFLFSSRYFARRFLFPEPARRDQFECLGGFRYGSFAEAFSAGSGCTWPYARLKADAQEIGLDTPWGPLVLRKDGLRLSLKRSPWSAELELLDPRAPRPLYFVVVPWRAGAVVRKLSDLGYAIHPG